MNISTLKGIIQRRILVNFRASFFQAGSLGYSATRHRGRYDGLRLRTDDWRVRPLCVNEVESSYFSDRTRFPAGTIEFDHALVMREVSHSWLAAPPIVSCVRRGEPQTL